MSSLKGKFENPAVLAATIASLTTLCITLVTAASALLTAHIQSQADIEKSVRENKRLLVVNAFQSSTYDVKLISFIDAGVLPDDDCKLRRALLHYSADCRPPEK
jgi:hypothetical protein